MPRLTLVCFPGSCARATMIALEEAGAVYETRVVNLHKGEQRQPEHLAMDPRGKVPVLLVDGVPLAENVAILSWLADTYPQAKLLPGDALARAQALSVVSWLASAVLTAMSRIVRPERITDEEGAFEGIRTKARADIAASLAIAEAHMSGRQWWGEAWSVADAYLYYMFNAVRLRGIDGDAFPALLDHSGRMEARPATRRMLDWDGRARAALAA